MLKQIVATSIVASTLIAAGAAFAQPQPPSRGPGAKPKVSYPESRTVVTQTRFAVVAEDGITARGRGVVSSQQIAGFPGAYEVIFSRNVTKCAYNATQGFTTSEGTAPSGEITVVGRFGNANGVFIQTYDSAGTAINRGFHLQVLCP